MAGSLGPAPQRAQAQPPATWREHWFEHNQAVSGVFLDNDPAPNPVLKGNTFTVPLATYDATAPMKISLVDVNRTAVLYKKANASGVSVNTGSVAGGIYILIVTNGKKYYTRKIVIQ
jgi:hypothetical protein